MGFTLNPAAAHGHRRIIFAIPHALFIDQTAATFCGLFRGVVLELHSAIDTDKPGAARPSTAPS
jgi:CRISPR-associated endonuclease/helicase Cas3